MLQSGEGERASTSDNASAVHCGAQGSSSGWKGSALGAAARAKTQSSFSSILLLRPQTAAPLQKVSWTSLPTWRTR